MILKKHPYPPEAWFAVPSEKTSPDKRVVIDRVAKLPDRCLLTFEYRSPTEAPSTDEIPDLDEHGDFYVGAEPKISRILTFDHPEGGSKVVLELIVIYPSAIYRAETQTLYICS